ncbi:MAG: chemotaxis protein CheW [Magnetococcales bacterium]|nr:chemotaxis protein CheW [Magnetococcales bacterium]
MSYVTLGIGEEKFAVEVGIVREILDSRPVSRLPNAPPFLCGVIDVRGCTVPVIDLRIKLGLVPVPPTDDTRILVVDLPMQDRNLVIGMQVDRVIEVADFASELLETAPDIGVQWKSDYIKAIGRLHGDFVIIFDMQRLFSTSDIASLHTS